MHSDMDCTRNNLEINETKNLLVLYNLAVLEKVALETPVADVLMHHEI